ncbi:hypothetical protein [Paenarthrobacter sp. NPDC057981]|uniref:hypothetical protein n=1 Tax=Paenarthrobacter sp. NPDC057981 TaxID=3346297 RepID=UPI0036D969D5
MSELAVFVAEWGPYVAKGVATGLGMQMVTGIVKAGKLGRRKHAEEQFDGLYGAIAAGVVGAVWRSVAYDSTEQSDTEAWAVYESESWWDLFTDRVLEPMSGSKSWELYVQHFVTGSTDSLESIRECLESEVGDLHLLSEELSIDIDDFLFWLGPCIREELQTRAAREATSFADLTQLLPSIPEVNQTGSPASIRRGIRTYLEWVLRCCKARMNSPLTEAKQNAGKLDRPARVHVTVRRDVEKGRQVYEPLSIRSESGGRTKVVPWDEMAARDGHLAVLGDPGTGKTLLVHREARRLAIDALTALESQVKPEDLHLPVIVRCDVLHEIASKDAQLSFEAACANLQDIDNEFYRDWFTRHLQTTPNTYLLDALDEVPAESGSAPWGCFFITVNFVREKGGFS